jgi:saccharopine dehydrogenase-like NADP-dependent oxidoreductase
MPDICRMKQILLFGAGKSATVLINYLLANASKENWIVTVADANLEMVQEKLNNSPSGKAVSFDITDDTKRRSFINSSDIVISMLPPSLHGKVAKDCLQFSKHLLTASYVDDDMRSMKSEIANKKVLFLCEMGLDPGIDHMSAMMLIDRVHSKGGNIVSFKSHCGGLVAPESDDNPWHYKISWNPRNIVMAGKAGAVYKIGGKIVKIPYETLFDEKESVNIPGLGTLQYYPNRDSLSYLSLYHLESTSTFLRTTLRHPDFCTGWKYVIKAGLTDENSNSLLIKKECSFREWLDASVASRTTATNFEDFLVKHVDIKERALVRQMFEYLGLFDSKIIPGYAKSSADVLQFAMENKLSLQANDKDMIVMLHEFEYNIGGKQEMINTSLVVKGDDRVNTAMAKTVGLPLGIATKLILDGTIQSRGLHIPVSKDIYDPVLRELEQYGVKFNEEMS